MVRSKDTPHTRKFVVMATCHNNINKQTRKRKKESHVLRFMAIGAFAVPIQIFLDSAAGSAVRGDGARLQQEEQVGGLRWTDAILHSWYTADPVIRAGDSPPALRSW